MLGMVLGWKELWSRPAKRNLGQRVPGNTALIWVGCALVGHKQLPGDSKRSQNENLVTLRGWDKCVHVVQVMMVTNQEGPKLFTDLSLWKKNTLQAHKTDLRLQISESFSRWKGDKCVECSESAQLSEMSLRKWLCHCSGCAHHLLCERVSKDGERGWTRQNLKDTKKQTPATSLKLQGIPEKMRLHHCYISALISYKETL